jgi:hypothetical protein
LDDICGNLPIQFHVEQKNRGPSAIVAGGGVRNGHPGTSLEDDRQTRSPERK